MYLIVILLKWNMNDCCIFLPRRLHSQLWWKPFQQSNNCRNLLEIAAAFTYSISNIFLVQIEKNWIYLLSSMCSAKHAKKHKHTWWEISIPVWFIYLQNGKKKRVNNPRTYNFTVSERKLAIWKEVLRLVDWEQAPRNLDLIWHW